MKHRISLALLLPRDLTHQTSGTFSINRYFPVGSYESVGAACVVWFVGDNTSAETFSDFHGYRHQSVAVVGFTA